MRETAGKMTYSSEAPSHSSFSRHRMSRCSSLSELKEGTVSEKKNVIFGGGGGYFTIVISTTEFYNVEIENNRTFEQ